MGEERSAIAYALKILAVRDRGEAEMRRKLEVKGFSPVTADRVIEKLQRSGYLDDERFAYAWAESALRNGRGYGHRLKVELSRRGVVEDIIDHVLCRLGSEHDEMATLAGLMARKFAGFDYRQADDRQKRRVISYFQRRGFSLAAILRVLRETGE